MTGTPTSAPATAIGIELAGCNWALSGLEGRHLGRLRQACVPLADPPCSSTVSWHWRDREGADPFQELDRVFNIDFDYGEDEIRASGPRFNAYISLRPQVSAEVEILRSAEPMAQGIIENVLRVLMAYRVTLAGGLLLHSACFTDGRRAWVVFGHSGAGKSTCSEFALDAGFPVLSDDMNVLLPGEAGWSACRVPFAGTTRADYGGPAQLPIESVSQLRQSALLGLEPMSPATAVATLLASAAFVNEDPWRAERLFGNCERLTRAVPVNALYFRRDPGFLNLLTGASRDAQAVA